MNKVKLSPQCIRCILKKYLNCDLEDLLPDEKIKYMQGVLKILGNADVTLSAPEIVEQITEFKNNFAKIADYSEIKIHFNNLLLSKENEIEDKICAMPNPLRAAVKYAMTGNFIDFGAMDNVDEIHLKQMLDKFDKIVIDESEFEQFESEVLTAKNIVYLIDNCGEIVLDKLLIKQILKLNNKVNIDVIVRGKPVLNDCTIYDARQVGLDKIVNVIGNGTGISGTVLRKISTQALGIIDNADMVISKGQGNFETLYGCGKNIYYLFLCKCKMFAQRFNVEEFTGMFINDLRLNFD